MKNKGEVSTAAVVGIITLVLSIVIILLFYFRIDLGGNLDDELCHNSVVLRGTAIASSNLLQAAVPLKCKTKVICFTKDGTCEKMVSPKIKKVKTDEDIYKVIADEMANCWWMFGEGNVDYIGKGLDPGMYCSLCDQIAFDNSVDAISIVEHGQKEILKFTYREDLFNYLSQHNVSGKDISYTDYIYGSYSPTKKELKEQEQGNTNVDTLCKYYCSNKNKIGFCTMGTFFETPTSKVYGTCYSLSKQENPAIKISSCLGLCDEDFTSTEVIIHEKQTAEELQKKGLNFEFGTIDFNKQYYVMMGESRGLDEFLTTLVAGGAGATTGAVLVVGGIIASVVTGGVAVPAVMIGIAALTVGGGIGAVTYVATVIIGASGQQYLLPTLVEASDDFEKLKCNNVATLG